MKALSLGLVALATLALAVVGCGGAADESDKTTTTEAPITESGPKAFGAVPDLDGDGVEEHVVATGADRSARTYALTLSMLGGAGEFRAGAMIVPQKGVTAGPAPFVAATFAGCDAVLTRYTYEKGTLGSGYVASKDAIQCAEVTARVAGSEIKGDEELCWEIFPDECTTKSPEVFHY